MKEQTPTIILVSREQLLVLTTAIIVAGIAANYSTVCPSTSHVYIARGVARFILESTLDGQK